MRAINMTNNPILILGNGAPDRSANSLISAPAGSIYLDTENLPHGGQNITSDSGATTLSTVPIGLMGNDGILYGQLWISADYQTVFINTLQDDSVIGVVPNVWVSGIQSYSLKDKPNNEIHFIYAANPNAALLDVSITAQQNTDNVITSALVSVIGGSKAGSPPPAQPPSSKAFSWGSISYGGPATNGSQPTGGISLSAQMQINGAPEYVIQGVFDNTISETKNEKWQGTFFGNVPAFQPSNPHANAAYAIAIKESASIGEQFPEIRIIGLDPSKVIPTASDDGLSGLDNANDLGRLVRSRGFENFNNVGTQSYEIGEVSYKPQPDSGRDFISGASGPPAISFRQISWQGSHQIGGAWVNGMCEKYAIYGYWGSPSTQVVRGISYGAYWGNPSLIARYSSKAGLGQPVDSTLYCPAYGNSWRNDHETWISIGDWQNGSTPIFSGAAVSSTNSLTRNFMRKSNASGNISGSTEAVYSIYGGADSGDYVELVLGANGKLFWNQKSLNVSTAEETRFQKIASTGQFPKFVNNYINRHATTKKSRSISDILDIAERIDALEKRLKSLEQADK
ncbi:ankyrin repeat domain-containing protein 22 [Lasius niger]|uniref:Ankyrin repeat domain-containing protein 22 n=1 Tax=Lasius niger TaxID=67767 RepID=A0A0J7NBI8_LASNI|nr:ankyrin repeat domain-containing protein 22 [Lasius niger]